MERTNERTTRPAAWLWITAAVVLLFGLPAAGPTEAFEASQTQGGMNPAAQRQEMIRLLGSIDKTLKDLLEVSRAR